MGQAVIGEHDPLVSAARAGDERAQDELVAAYLPLVYNVVGRALHGHADVDDVVQETMLRALAGLGTLRDPASFRSWLVAIAMNEVRRHWRERPPGDAPRPLQEAHDVADPGADFVDLTILRLGLVGQRRETAEATRWLDTDDRALLSLWWLEVSGQLTRAEVAAAMELSPQHTAVRVQRMKAQLETARVVVRALAANPGCASLGELTAAWDGVPSALWRKRLARHVRDCPDCSGHGSGLVVAERLLVGLALVPLPAAPAGAWLMAGTPDIPVAAAYPVPGGAPGTDAAARSGAGTPPAGAGTSSPSGAGASAPAGPAAGRHRLPRRRRTAAVSVAAGVVVLVTAGAIHSATRSSDDDHKAVRKAPAAPAAAPSASPPPPGRRPPRRPRRRRARRPRPPAPPARRAAPGRPRPPRRRPVPPPPPRPPRRPRRRPGGGEVVQLVNAERARNGCAPMSVNSRLTAAAQGHSDDMARRDFFDHTNPDGAGPGERITAAGYRWSTYGENIAAGQRTAADVMRSWMDSPGHRANILNCSFTEIGIGYREGAGGPWWTQNFGAR
ncbi:sigma-70 family RNA polymerase sigma factor [Streptomyces pactum]|uniref:sigma-70 family RNA polymerase sigma factor n=1 Tax=Streptomyces pactum TaxID=68249 RepID=UPI0027DD9CCC|nr:sigma-70 family RNA polymerase sigma factor [Streptomyces pactum]